MTTIACRWPGGMVIALHRPNLPPITVQLKGPPGAPREIMDAADPSFKHRPSKSAAHKLHKETVDTVHDMQRTSDKPTEELVYATTEVSGQFWNAWFEENKDFDVIKHRMVFEVPA